MNASSMRRSRSIGYVCGRSDRTAGAQALRRPVPTPACRPCRVRSDRAIAGPQRGATAMFTRRVLVTSLTLALLSAPAFAQAPQPVHPAKPAPSAAAPAKPATTGAATASQVAKINLNTAPVAELDKLPQIGSARSKAIIEARTKSKFKDWNDFVARKVVPAEAAAAIKDVVTF